VSATPSPRYYALDGLRASMMLLGIVLHASVSYIVTVLPASAWGYKDRSTSVIADFLVLGIHVFRMPVFFVMAGFFAALLVERYGVAGMLRNRASRVLLPFLIFWTILSPLIILGITFATTEAAGGHGLSAVSNYLATGPLWIDSTLHLWFLYFLLFFYVLTAVLRWAARAVPHAWNERLSTLFRFLMGSRIRVLVLSLPTTATLAFQGGSLQTPNDFTPSPVALIGYVVFFAFGWALYRHRDLLGTMTQNAWAQTIAGFVLIPVSVIAQGRAGIGAPLGAVLGSSVVGALCVWLLIFGITGLFLRYLDRPSRRVRYLTDAAYWLYLIHLPFMFWVPGVLAPFDWPALVKITVVLALVTPMILLTYHYLVRATFIGAMLNGRRYSRALPAVP
jgi:glucans biosynthesis protein C